MKGKPLRQRTNMARRIVRLRKGGKGYKWTQEQMADALQVTTRTVQNWEAGATRPRKRDLVALARLARGCGLKW
jgi:DNA-binding transcriptional regulator YiaG